nr:Rab family GTPase [Candidatus Njordarchaeum guaymaensis]
MTPGLKKYTFKVIFLGDAAVGKTSIVAKHVTSTFRENYIPSLGANITSREYSVEGKDITLLIWDIAAQEEFSRVRQEYYRGVKAAFIVYDVTRPKTFQNVVSWYDDLTTIISKKIPIILIGNKADLPAVVYSPSGKRLADDLKADFIETSAKTGDNIEKVFDKVVRKLSGASAPL